MLGFVTQGLFLGEKGRGGYKPGNLTRSMSLFSLSGLPVKSDDKIISELMKWMMKAESRKSK